MTGTELIAHVCLLGARTAAEFDEEFQYEFIYSACNRAISECNKLLPLKKHIQLLNYPIRPVQYHPDITVHRGGVDISFNASGIKSLAFAICGTGNYCIMGENAMSPFEGTFTDQQKFTVVSHVIARTLMLKDGATDMGKITLTFKGEYNYLIRDVSFYDELEGPVEGDVTTYTDWVGYDMKDGRHVSEGFIAFASSPVRCHNVSLTSPEDYRIEGSVIYLKAAREGIYEIACFIEPRKLDANNVSFELDVDRRLHDLVTLRAAQYIYAIADEEAAAVCKAEFERQMGITLVTMREAETPTQFRDVRGW